METELMMSPVDAGHAGSGAATPASERTSFGLKRRRESAYAAAASASLSSMSQNLSAFTLPSNRARPPDAAAARMGRGTLRTLRSTCARRKLEYPQNSSSPPRPESATLMPASLTAFDTTHVFTPSIVG